MPFARAPRSAGWPRATLALLALLLAAAALPARAQIASRVEDLAAAARGGEDGGSDPQQFFTAGGKLYFTAVTERTGRELYVTDGTPAGTELLADICPGDCSSSPTPLAAAGNALLFAAMPDGLSGRQVLWRSDGTRAGTYPLTNGAGQALQLPGAPSLASFGGRVYVTAFGDGFLTVWRTDGTQAGTAALSDLLPALPAELSGAWAVAGKLFLLAQPPYPTPASLWTSDGNPAGTRKVADLDFVPLAPIAAGGHLFLVADSTQQLWASDGTPAGTRQVSSFPGSHPFGESVLGSPSVPTPFHPFGGRLYFVADDVFHGQEIWVSDGTSAGTRRVTDFGYATPFDSWAGEARLAVLGDRVLFYAYDGLTRLKLWTSDGSPGSTAPLSDATPDSNQSLVQVGGKVVFAEDSPIGVPFPRLWVTDGTAAGTAPLTGCPGRCATSSPLTGFAGAAYFVLGGALWRTDGTPAGTRRLTDPDRLDFASSPYDPVPLGALGRSVVFPGHDPAYGVEPWVSDGTPAGSRLVADVNREVAGSLPDQLAAAGADLFFTACPAGQNRQVFHTAGPGTTAQLTTGGDEPCDESGGAPPALVTAGGAAYFLRDDDAGDTRLWKSDGTVAGTGLVGSAQPAFGSPLAAFGGRVLFVANDPDGTAIWATDGTPQGTARAFAFPSPADQVREMTVLGNEVYLAVADPDLGVEAWRSDGTQAGTVKLTDFASFAGTVSGFVRLGSTVYFVGDDKITGAELWKTDGTRAGTVQVTDLYPGSGGSFPTDLTAFQGSLYFFALTPSEGRGLWRSDGSAAGTVLVRDFRAPFSFQPQPAGLTVVGGELFFAADDGISGRELWKSDGTANGTVLVRDLLPGPGSSSPASLTAAAGRLYFTADDGVHGAELWVSDGKVGDRDGTRLIEDISPGADPASPDSLTVAGDRLYFSADDGATGRELWTLPLSGPAGCQPTDTRLCVAAGRFQVEVAWKDFQSHTGVGHAISLTADTGYFWFFDPANVETVVKVLDARTLNQSFWVFYGALSSVEYTITVTDTATGLTRRYFNPAGQLASVGDTRGFGPSGAFDTKTAVAPASPPPLVSARTDPRAATGSCTAGPGTLCLQGNRFAVTAAWKDFSGHTGTGTAVPLTGDTGYFWFFSPTNVEVIAKVLDGRPVNQKFWLFYGALSNVFYTLTVTDTQTGAVKTYRNPLGQFGSVADTGAF